MNIQTAYAKALLVDAERLAAAQREGDVLGAHRVYIDAFETDVRPLLARARAKLGVEADPVEAFRGGGYASAWRRSAARPASRARTSASDADARVIKTFIDKVKELGSRVRAFYNDADGWGVAARWSLAIGLFLLALVMLVFLSWLLRGAGLWGDLAFAILVTTGVFWIIRRLAQPLLTEGPYAALFRAFATTIFVLVGVPVAYVTRPVGVVLLFLPMLAWAGFRIAYRFWRRPERKPVFWQAEVGGVLLLGLVLLVAPAVGSTDHVPRAVPPANVEGGELDAAIAERFRPLLFFDSSEQLFPLDIEDALATRRVKMCRKAVGDDSCDTVVDPAEIDENLDYLVVDDASGTPPGGDERSAVYSHVVRHEGRVYVDYWWFYSRNPSPVAGKVFCGPGLRTPPFTCQEHVGDWEGVTVVLGPCEEQAEDCQDFDGELLGPEEVRYGQHEHVAAYDWDSVLKPFWGALQAPTAPALRETWESVVLPAVAAAGGAPGRLRGPQQPCLLPGPLLPGLQAADPRASRGACTTVQCPGCTTPPATSARSRSRSRATANRRSGTRFRAAGASRTASSRALTATCPAPRRGRRRRRRYEEPYSDEVVPICLAPSGPPRLRRC